MAVIMDLLSVSITTVKGYLVINETVGATTKSRDINVKQRPELFTSDCNFITKAIQLICFSKYKRN